MPRHTPIIAWARSPVAPVGGALSHLQVHELAAPLLQSLLAQSSLPATAVDAVVLGNALGAGGNPARMLALAAGLPDHCAAHTVDTQCCSGLDAIAMAVGLLQSGQAEVVIAGGAEAWSRAPIRQTRPMRSDEAPQSYERPPFAPDPELEAEAARLTGPGPDQDSDATGSPTIDAPLGAAPEAFDAPVDADGADAPVPPPYPGMFTGSLDPAAATIAEGLLADGLQPR